MQKTCFACVRVDGTLQLWSSKRGKKALKSIRAETRKQYYPRVPLKGRVSCYEV